MNVDDKDEKNSDHVFHDLDRDEDEINIYPSKSF